MNKDTLKFIWGLIMTIICSLGAGASLDGLINSEHHILWGVILFFQICGIWTGIGHIEQSIEK